MEYFARSAISSAGSVLVCRRLVDIVRRESSCKLCSPLTSGFLASLCSSSTALTMSERGPSLSVPSASFSMKCSKQDWAGSRSSGMCVPCLFLNSVIMAVQSAGSNVPNRDSVSNERRHLFASWSRPSSKLSQHAQTFACARDRLQPNPCRASASDRTYQGLLATSTSPSDQLSTPPTP